MEINSQLPRTSLYSLLNHQTQNDEKSSQPVVPPKKSQKTPQEVPTQPLKTESNPNLEVQKRETYGLLVLELMSDDEYQAFQRATVGMSEGEKMLAAQSLYSLTSFYNGKYTPEFQSDLENKTAQKAFGIGSQNDFLERYKNAYNAAQKVDITL